MYRRVDFSLIFITLKMKAFFFYLIAHMSTISSIDKNLNMGKLSVPHQLSNVSVHIVKSSLYQQANSIHQPQQVGTVPVPSQQQDTVPSQQEVDISPVAAGPTELEEFQEGISRLLVPSACDKEEWALCALVVGECIYECCSGYCVLAPSCIACMGELYERCKKCFIYF